MRAAPGGHSAKALKNGYSARDEARWIRSAGFAASLIGLTSAAGSVSYAPRIHPKAVVDAEFHRLDGLLDELASRESCESAMRIISVQDLPQF